jgi:hypothetical protein
MQHLGRCHIGKALGLDGLPYELWKAFPDVLEPIARLATFVMRGEAQFAEHMTTGIVTLVYKKRGSREDLRNYRPLTLLNADIKLIMGVVSNRLADSAERSGCISMEQLGFLRGRQIYDAIETVLDAVAFADTVNVALSVASVDWANAYDWVDRQWRYTTL